MTLLGLQKETMSRRILAGIGLLAVVIGSGYGGWKWYQTQSIPPGEASAVLQVPHDLMKRAHLFERSRSADGEQQLSAEVVEGALTRLRDREITLANNPGESARDSLISQCSVHCEPETGHDKVTVTYHSSSPAEALAALTAVVDTIREVRMPQRAGNHTHADGRPTQLTILGERESNLADRIQELEASLAQQADALESLAISEADRIVLPEQMKRLGVNLAEARKNRLEAEHRLIQTRKDLAAGLPVDVLASRLPGNDGRDVLQKAFAPPQLAIELRNDQADYERLLQTYGRKHPRMLQLQQKINGLEARIAAKASGSEHEAGRGSGSPAELLLRLLSADLEERSALESDLQEQFEAKKSTLDQQAGIAAAAERMQKELQTLRDERDSLRRKIVETRRQWQEHLTEVLVPPGIIEASGDSRLPLRALIGFIGGLAMATGLYLRRSRRNQEARVAAIRDEESFSPNFIPRPAPTMPAQPVATTPRPRAPVPSPLTALLANRKPVPPASVDQSRDKADRAARLARLKSLTQSPTLAPHSV